MRRDAVLPSVYAAARVEEAVRVAGGIEAFAGRLREAFGDEASAVARRWYERDGDRAYLRAAELLEAGQAKQ